MKVSIDFSENAMNKINEIKRNVWSTPGLTEFAGTVKVLLQKELNKNNTPYGIGAVSANIFLKNTKG